MKKHILIIGGMGPQASILLHQRLIQRAVELGATDGDEFPEITHLSIPVADFIGDQNKVAIARDAIKRRLYCLWRNSVYARGHCLQHRSFVYS